MKRWLFLMIGLMLVFPKGVRAAVSGPCSNCHIMHNSQNGTAVYASGPYRSLTKGGCVGCHTGINTGSNNIPYVTSSSAPTYGVNTLAGGSFYWVADTGGDDDAKGHNVVGIASQDANIGYTPPGWNTGFNLNGQLANGSATWASQLTCAGAYGCHGRHDVADDFSAISRAHHTNDDPDGNGIVDGDGLGNYTVGTSFRFLYGIKGIEDSDWEYTNSTTDHNQYYALDGTLDSESINYLCCECHGNFHAISGANPATSSPWFRHPTDFALSSATGSGYTSYPGALGTATGQYLPLVPLGSNLASSTPVSTVQFTGSDDIVLCISCHRAHGSPYDDLLRWDYNSVCSAGTANTACGCFACHTTKD